MNYFILLLKQFAAGLPSNCINTIFFGQVCDDCHGSSIFKILSFVISTFTIGIGLLATIGLIHGAILIMTSRDQSDRKSKGIKRIIETIIGMLLYATLAISISMFIPGGDLNAILNPQESTEGCTEAGSRVVGDGTIDLSQPGDGSNGQNGGSSTWGNSSAGGGQGGNTGGGNEATQTNKPIGPLTKDSDKIQCDPRTKFYKTYDKAHVNGKLVKINLCSMPNINGDVYVNSRVSGAYYALAEAYKKEYGQQLSASQSFRSYEKQQELYNEYKNNGGQYAAKPGESPHEGGLAIDFSIPKGDTSNGKKSTCASTQDWGNVTDNQSPNRWHYSITSHWFCDNLKNYGMQRPVKSEVWHVNPTTNYF